VPASPAPLLSAWHDFFLIIGTASATLIGAMFVVVSIGSGFLTRDRSAAIGTFLTSTVIHLSTILFGGALIMVPGLDWLWLGALVGLAALGGIAYSFRVMWGFSQHAGTVRSDWLWYVILPLAGYALLLAAGVIALRGGALSLDLLAVALSFLLVVGIRNAWDMITFLVTIRS